MSMFCVRSWSEIDNRHSSLFIGKDDPDVGLIAYPATRGYLPIPVRQKANPTRGRALAGRIGQLQKAKRASICHEEDVGCEVAAGNAGTADESHQCWPRRKVASLARVNSSEQKQPHQGVEIEHDSGPRKQKGNEVNSLPLKGASGEMSGLTAPHNSPALLKGNEGAKARNRQALGHDECVQCD
ncbi:hypothetical protein [Variovorax sp. Sphag1AA]|uniref:hypothetical protein n=1 Tax=Variovorax sp. Sphag1AA TaxID=2587027 RepID=UPI001619D845|nr:hypothetical protein [Variovorax sp. Sphag1AA]MBB3175674.1 hypothetical protein [Variovorax sp. Sphag1AA]